MDQLYRVLYCSRSHLPPDIDPVRAILATSRRNNGRVGITGGLLFSQGCFAQVLEGPIDVVTETFERIQCDERHGQVTVLQAGHIGGRDFPDWSMGYAGNAVQADIAAHPGLSQALQAGSAGSREVLDLMKAVIVREDDQPSHV